MPIEPPYEVPGPSLLNNLVLGSRVGAGSTVVNGAIQSLSYTAGSVGWAISSDGTVDLNNGNFRGDITGASGTFSGALSGATITGGSITGTTFNNGSGTFQVDAAGNLTASSATITGTVTSSNVTITGGTLNIGGGAFQVDSGGGVTASDVTITGGSLNINGGAFIVTSGGALTATSATITGALTAGAGSSVPGSYFADGTIPTGVGIDLANNSGTWFRSNNFVAGTSGWEIDGTGDAEFNSITIRGTATFGDTSDAHFSVDGTNGNVQLYASASVNRGYIDVASTTYGNGLLLSYGSGTTTKYGGASSGRSQLILGSNKIYLSGGGNDIVIGGLVAADPSGQGNDVYIQALDEILFYDGANKAASITSPSNQHGKLWLHSASGTSEGGEIELEAGSSGVEDAIIDNFHGSALGATDTYLRVLGDTTAVMALSLGSGDLRIGGDGVSYQGVTHGSAGSANRVGFTWSSPNLYGHVDDANTITVGTASDRRLKTNIRPILGQQAMQTVLRMSPVIHDALDFDGSETPNRDLPAFIADELEEVLPSLVVGERGPESYQTVNYAGAIPVLVAAIQDLDERLRRAGL